MWNWLKKLFKKKEPKQIKNVYLPEGQDRETKELLLLQEDICGKHHG